MATWVLTDAISAQSTQAGTEPSPSGGPSGIPLDGVIGITVWLDAGVGQTVTSDAGQADWWRYDGAWGIENLAPLQVPPGSAGQRRVSLGTIPVTNQRGYISPTLNGVLFSGSTATVEVKVTIDRRGASKPA